jgi:hypothetical protein
MSRSLKFSAVLAGELSQSSVERVPSKAFVVRGVLRATAVTAQLKIEVPRSFSEVKDFPPKVLCHESWMRAEPDWHNSSRQGMCWVLPNEWRDAMNWKHKPIAAIMSEGSQWLVSSVKLMVDRHYLASLERMEKWPSEWLAWSHYDEGVKEYRRLSRRRMP